MPDAVERVSAALADRYRLERELGAGGMATVYLAHDLKHDRQVAIKVLKPELAAVLGAERFVVEIKTTAALQHPHILPLFDSGSVYGPDKSGPYMYYVMPYIQGETLRSKLDRETQLGIDEAVRIAVDVASALHYAHEHGVIHRDIKPENILLHDGRPMVADFGIALALSAAAGGRMTETGMSLGTPHYMSPEQATAEKEISARSDVYSLASVLYEMLTGEPPHMGKSAQQIIMKIIAEPVKPVTDLRKSVPPHVADALAQALEKLPADRFASAAEFGRALTDAGRAPGRTTARAVPAHATTGWRDRLRDPLTLVLLLSALAAVTFGLTRGRLSPDAATGARSAHLSIVLPDGYELGSTNLHPIAISDDGARVAYVGLNDGRNRILVRALDEPEATVLEGTEGGEGPFFSPDGQWLAFFSGGQLRKIAVNGAALQALADASFHRGGDWGDDGYLYFAPTNTGGIWRVPEAGGAATEVTTVDPGAGEISHRWPHRIAGTGTLLFAAWTGPGEDEQHVAMHTIGARGHHRLVTGGNAPRYAANPGLLLYTDGGQLFTVPWRPSDRDLGTAVPVASDVTPNDRIGNEGSGNYAVSGHGTLVYLDGGRSAVARRVVWVDGASVLTTVPLPERAYENVALSPDGGRAVLQIQEGTTRLWVYDFARGTLTPLNTGNGSSQAPLWTPDGTRVVYRGTRQGMRNLYWIRVDGSGEEERLTSKPGVTQTPTSVSSDGRLLLFDETGPAEPGGFGIWVLPLDGDRTPRRLLPPSAAGRDAQLSPDGRWVAWQAPVSSRQEIFVAPFSGAGERHLVSTGGGTEPLWSRDGRALYFQSGTRLMGVTVTPGATFSASPPRLVHEGRFLASINGNTSYTIARDGARFLRIQPVEEAAAITRISMVLNWYPELRRQAASRAVTP